MSEGDALGATLATASLVPGIGIIPGIARILRAARASKIPTESVEVMRSIQESGVIVQWGVKGPAVPKHFENDDRKGGQILPVFDRNGREIEWRERGTVPAASNPNPGGERIVTGSDGSFYYTPDHYQTFVRWQP